MIHLEWKESQSMTYPHAQVPSVTYMEEGQQVVLYESLVLMQWVEDFFQGAGPELLPGSAANKAKARIIIGRCGGLRNVSRMLYFRSRTDESMAPTFQPTSFLNSEGAGLTAMWHPCLLS